MIDILTWTWDSLVACGRAVLCFIPKLRGVECDDVTLEMHTFVAFPTPESKEDPREYSPDDSYFYLQGPPRRETERKGFVGSRGPWIISVTGFGATQEFIARFSDVEFYFGDNPNPRVFTFDAIFVKKEVEKYFQLVGYYEGTIEFNNLERAHAAAQLPAPQR